MPSPAFLLEMQKLQGVTPRTQLIFIDKSNNQTDISDHYVSGANFEQVRQGAYTEIQAGQATIVCSNHDDLFSEFKIGSLLYNLDYIGAKIKVSQGFLLPDGTLEYVPQATLFIDELQTDPNVSEVTFSCRDILGFIMDKKLHSNPAKEIPVPAGGNVGNGVCSVVGTLPFVTVNQAWTLACVTPGPDGTAFFTVTGSIVGYVTNAKSGTEYVDLTNGVRFTIHAGSTNWAIGDTFTFTLAQHPQWTNKNAAKVLWSILTGYDWDTNTQEVFHDLVFDFDHTQSDANTDIDYLGFATLVSVIDSIGVFAITGYIPYNTDSIAAIQNLIIMFLGTLYSDADGRFQVTTYVPPLTPSFTTFSDTGNVFALDYYRLVDEVINSVVVAYKASLNWAWSTGSETMDGSYANNDATSVSNRGVYNQDFTIPWYAASGAHVQDFADKLIARYKDPPLELEWQTRMDGLLVNMGDRVIINDTKLGLVGAVAEVTRIVKQFDQQPANLQFRARQDATANQLVGAIGSTANEGDGISPQSDNYDTASTSDKQFGYFSKVGSSAPPQYTVF
jgi:hypothetical protein